MAQVVDYYSATAGGGSAMYYWPSADAASGGTRIYSGTAIRLASDYASTASNSRYRMISPSGWINWTYVQNITAVYKTVTDACTAPTSVTINTATKVMSIAGGGGGDLNDFSAFGISWRERAINSSSWGGWSGDTDVTSRTVSVTANSGMVRQYRVRTKGSAGSSYYSSYVVCNTLVNGNTAAGTPAVLAPLSGMTTHSKVIAVQIECPAEPDGDTMTLQRSMNGNAWADVVSVAATGGITYDLLSLYDGTHTVKYRLVDANGEYGGEDVITFTYESRSWNRTISSGDVIANKKISFVADIQEMLERVNVQRTFYGLTAATLPGTPGRIGDWGKQLLAMQEAINETREKIGRMGYDFATPSSWPSAAEINQLRTAIENT